MSHNGSRSSSPARVPEWDLLELHQAHLLGVLVIITGIRGHNHWDQGLALISSVLPRTTSPCSRHQLTPPCPSRGLCHFQGQPNRLQLPLLGIAAPGNTPGSGSPSDRSNLSIPAPQSWRKPRQEHSCLIYIVNILSFKSAPMVFPLLLHVVSARKWLLCSLQNKPQQQNSPGLGDTVGHGDVLGGQGTLLRASVSTPTVLPPAGTSPILGSLDSAGSSTKRCRGGDAQPPSGVVEQKCRIPTQIQTPAGRGVRGNPGSLERAKEGEKPMQRRGPGATAPPEQGTHLHPLTGAPSLGSTGYTGS